MIGRDLRDPKIREKNVGSIMNSLKSYS
jgi:hypothetical protein